MRKPKSADDVVINLEAGGSVGLRLEQFRGHSQVRLATVKKGQPWVMVWLDEEAIERALTAMEALHERWWKSTWWRRLLGLRKRPRAISVGLLDGATLVLSVLKGGSELMLKATDGQRRNSKVLLPADEADDLYEAMSELYDEVSAD